MNFVVFFLHKLWTYYGQTINSSSRPEVFCKKGVLRSFTKFTGKQLCQSLFFNKVTLIASAKLRSVRGASHQPAVMVSCLTISHTSWPCLPSGRVSYCVPGFTEVRSCCYSRKWVWKSRTKLCCMASTK